MLVMSSSCCGVLLVGHVFSPTPTPLCVRVCVCQVWNANVLVDRFMGQRSGAVPAVGHTERVTGKLMGRRRHRNEETQGTITFKIECSNDLRAT